MVQESTHFWYISIAHKHTNLKDGRRSITSYWVMMPLGSRGSFHRSEILSSDGVALTNSLGTGPGTTAQTERKLNASRAGFSEKTTVAGCVSYRMWRICHRMFGYKLICVYDDQC